MFAFTLFAYLAGRTQGIKLFWNSIFLPVVTSIATCSSAASLPANLIAAKKMRVPPEIYETVIPLGTIIHKDGSVIGGVFKIAFLFRNLSLKFFKSGRTAYCSRRLFTGRHSNGSNS